MAIPSFFKQNKPRGFNYVPRYYDPVKEELEQRRKAWSKDSSSAGATEDGTQGEEQGPAAAEAAEDRLSSARAADYGQRSGVPPARPEDGPAGAEAMAGKTSQPYRSRIMRGDMRNHFRRRKERVERHTTIRLLVIIIIIVLVVYLYLRF